MDRSVLRACAGVLLASMVAMTAAASAQPAPKRTPEQIRASFDAHKGEFDYLLGEWEFTAMSREHGKFPLPRLWPGMIKSDA